MIYIVDNAVPILLAALASTVFSFSFYRLVVGRQLSGVAIAVTFIAEAWIAAILAGALILAPPEAGAWTMAIGTAIIIWIGFVVPSLIVSAQARGYGVHEPLVDGGHWLIALLVQVAVLMTIGLVPPA